MIRRRLSSSSINSPSSPKHKNKLSTKNKNQPILIPHTISPQPNTPQKSHNFLMEKNSIMPKSNRANSFIIHVKNDQESYRGRNSAVSDSPARIMSRIRRILMRFVFYFPSRGSSSSATMASKQRNLEKFEPPKTSCSSNYSSYSHYNEAIADCIEFFKKSSQDQIGVEGNGISDVNEMV